MVFQKCDFTETGAPELACLQFVAENVKPNSLPVQLNKNLILIYFSKQGPKLRLPGRQCDQTFSSGDQNFIVGRQLATS